MDFLIHTPDFAMKAAILVSSGIGCSCVAGNIYSRYFTNTRVSSMSIQFAIRLYVVILGICFFPQLNFFHISLWGIIPSIVTGIVGGLMIVRFELWNERKYFEQLSTSVKVKKKPSILEKDIGEIENFELGLCAKPQKVSDWKNRSLFYIYEIKNKNESYSAFTLVGVALLEECIFRGYLLNFCFLLPPYYDDLAVISLIFIFGAKHIHARSREFLAKSFLGFITTLETLCLGNILAAIITHGYLNYYVYQQRKKMGAQG